MLSRLDSLLASKDVFILVFTRKIYLFLKAYHQCLTVFLGTNQETRQA